MTLEIINEEIVGTIENLEAKLNGKLPITREELLVLVNSWGRKTSFYTKDSQNKDIYIESCEVKECYDLSKLDTSEITNMNDVFIYSLFEGDISNWNMSNVTDMELMFCGAESFNQPLNSWDVSNVTNMSSIFANTKKFNQNISSWNVSNVTDMSYMFSNAKKFNQNISKWNLEGVKRCFDMFDDAKDFELKYNSSKPLPINTEDIKEWLINSREKMNMIDVKDKYGKEIDDFFSNFSNKEFSKEI